MNHTLGPWHMHSVDGCGYYVLGPGPEPQFICTLDEGNHDCQAANAAVIAAAPEMLLTLQAALYALKMQWAKTGAVDDYQRLENAKRAIKKAEGREE